MGKFENKYTNLGGMSKKRIPDVLHSELERLFTVLNDLAQYEGVREDCEPGAILSEMCGELEESLETMRESE